MDLQDPRFTTPPPDYSNLYNTEALLSIQPYSPPFSLPNSQKTIQLWDSYNGPRLQIDKSQPIQSWDSRDLLPDSQLLPDSLFIKSILFPLFFIPDFQIEPKFSLLYLYIYIIPYI